MSQVSLLNGKKGKDMKKKLVSMAVAGLMAVSLFTCGAAADEVVNENPEAFDDYARPTVVPNDQVSIIYMVMNLTDESNIRCENQMAGTVSLEDVVNLIFSLPEQYRRNGTLLMNEKTLLSLHKQCLAQGTNLWFGKTNDGKDDTFFGYRIVRSGAMPDAETGNTPILFGDFKKAYVNDCGKRAMKRLSELYSLSTHIGFLLSERVGIKLMEPDAIKSLKVA